MISAAPAARGSAIRTFLDALVEWWDGLKARMDRLLGPFFEQHVTDWWFPPLFWGLMVPLLVFVLTGLLWHPLYKLIALSVIPGVIFGFALPRAKPFADGEQDRLAQAAAKGDLAACRALGLRYLNGAPGVPRERELARQWFLAGAEGGDRQCMVLLADLMAWGLGGPRDPEGAAQWQARSRAKGAPVG